MRLSIPSLCLMKIFFQHQCFTRPPFSKYKDSPLLGISNSVVCNLKVFHICSGFSSTFLCTSFLKIFDTINRFLKVIGIVANIEVEENPQPEYIQKAADLESSLTLGSFQGHHSQRGKGDSSLQATASSGGEAEGQALISSL